MTKRLTHRFDPSSNALPFTGSGHGSTGGRINPSNDSSLISLYYRQRQARGLPVRFTRRNADFSRLNAPALHASRLTAATVLTNCPPSTALLTLRTRSKTPPQPLGRLEELLGRRWDGLKRKKPLQSLVWDGGTAGTGGGGVCHLLIAALDTKLPSFWTSTRIL